VLTDMGETPRTIFVTSARAQRANLQYGIESRFYIVHKNKSLRPTGIYMNTATSKSFLIEGRAEWTRIPPKGGDSRRHCSGAGRGFRRRPGG
jgi:hypothetical protein